MSALYDNGRKGFLDGDISWSGHDIRAILIDTVDYTANLASDIVLSGVPAAARVSTSSAFTSKTSISGIADADDLVFSAVTGDSVEALVIYQHTGVEATSKLIAYIDTGIGLPITPNGADITVQWDNGSNKIFKL